MSRACIHCKHFTDGHYSKTYISPICNVLGRDEDACYMRLRVCGLQGVLFKPKPAPNPEREGHAEQFKN